MLARDVAESVIRQAWTKKVHISPEDEFSECLAGCDCCRYRTAFDVYKTPRIDAVKILCDPFNVKSPRSGKVYTYYGVTATAIEWLFENCKDAIESEAEILGIIVAVR